MSPKPNAEQIWTFIYAIWARTLTSYRVGDALATPRAVTRVCDLRSYQPFLFLPAAPQTEVITIN